MCVSVSYYLSKSASKRGGGMLKYLKKPALVKLLSVHVSGELKTVDFQTENNVRNDLVGWLDTSSVHAQKLKPNFDLLPLSAEKTNLLSKIYILIL